MISYSHLYSWRNLCEYLNSCKYKFAQPCQIKRDCKCLPSLYWKDRTHRQFLFDNYLIQLIHWCPEPDFSYRRRRKDDDWGWQLCSYWEFKIAYLESIVLFDVEPAIKFWEPELKSRMAARAERQAKLELEKELRSLPKELVKLKCASLGICYRCFNPIITYMVDCISCGAIQE